MGGALGERGGENRQRGGRDHRAAQTLDRTSGDQQALAVGEAAGQRGQREQHQPGDEHPPSTKQIGGTATEQQEARERDRVGVDDPLEVRFREVQAAADRRQRDVDDRHVEDHHELGQAGQQQRGAEVRTLVGVLGGSHVPPASW